MKVHLRSAGAWLLFLGGGLLAGWGVWMAHFFYKFPAIPGFLTVTFWRDTVAFATIAAAGAALMVGGILRLARR